MEKMEKIMTVNDELVAFSVTKDTPGSRFLASLSDGRTVIQDSPKGAKHAWSRLASWLKANPDISITGLRFQRSNGVIIDTPPNQKGYFLGNKQFAVWGGSQTNLFGLGYCDGDKINVVWYQQPKFDKTMPEERPINENDFFLIMNKNKND